MKTKFNELFPNGICFDTAGHGTLMQDRYNELDDGKIDYIETATLMHHEMYEMLLKQSELMGFLDEQTHPNIELDAVKYEIDRLLAKARGEHE